MTAKTEQLFPLRREGFFSPVTTDLEKMRRKIHGLIETANNWKGSQIEFDEFKIKREKNERLGGESTNIGPVVMFHLTRPDGFVFNFGSIFHENDSSIDRKIGDISAVLAVAAILPKEFCNAILENGNGYVAVVTRPPWQTEDKFPRSITRITFSRKSAREENSLSVTNYEIVYAESAYDQTTEGPQHLIVNSGIPMLKQKSLRK